ncbi:hypothetical protein MHYP_G00246190 [Metynnis hypsauchen]
MGGVGAESVGVSAPLRECVCESVWSVCIECVGLQARRSSGTLPVTGALTHGRACDLHRVIPQEWPREQNLQLKPGESVHTGARAFALRVRAWSFVLQERARERVLCRSASPEPRAELRTALQDRMARAWVAPLLLALLVRGARAQLCPPQCTCAGTAVDCHAQGLRSVPRGITRSAERIDLNNNNLTKITKADFAGLRHLRVLQLMENRISVIERGAFQDLKELERL